MSEITELASKIVANSNINNFEDAEEIAYLAIQTLGYKINNTRFQERNILDKLEHKLDDLIWVSNIDYKIGTKTKNKCLVKESVIKKATLEAVKNLILKLKESEAPNEQI